MSGPSADDIARARKLLEGVAIPTPVEESRWLSKIAGGPVLLKAENLQRAGSFKIRGAYVRMAGLSADERQRGVVAASAGNHAQGVALAAQLLGIKAVVYMPNGAPIPKEKATRGYGAEVRFQGSTIDEALVAARAYADETGRSSSTPSTTPTSWPARRRAGSRSSSSAPTCGRSSCRPVVGVCWPASRQPSRTPGPTYGSSACRPRAPRRTRCRCLQAARRR